MNYTFTFTEKQINLILNLLAEKPYKDVFDVIETIKQQAAKSQAVVKENKSLDNEKIPSPDMTEKMIKRANKN